MFDKKQKRCVKRIHLVTDDGLSDGLSSMNNGGFINYKCLSVPFEKNKVAFVIEGFERDKA